MPADRTVNPLQALRWCAEKLNRRPPQAYSPDEAPPGYLAADVHLSARRNSPDSAWAGPHVAARNGYAIGEGMTGGVYPLLGVIAAGGMIVEPRTRDGPRPDETDVDAPPTERGVWRIETGAPMPRGTDRVLPVSSGVMLGGERVRLRSTAATGDGVHCGFPNAPTPLVVPAGSQLDDRLRSLLLVGGVESVLVTPPASVGFGSIGDELIDLSVEGPAVSGQSGDISGYWLGDAIAGCGQKAVALGILPDQPERIRSIVQICRGRHLEMAILSGAVGLGCTDRVVESLRQLDARVLFTRVALNEGLGFVLAKTHGVDVLALCGRPLWCSALFDLFVGPALRANSGAMRPDWDWSQCRQPFTVEGLEDHQPDESATWGLFPALVGEGTGAPLRVAPTSATYPWWPRLPNQRGWLVAQAQSDGWEPAYFVTESRGEVLVT